MLNPKTDSNEYLRFEAKHFTMDSLQILETKSCYGSIATVQRLGSSPYVGRQNVLTCQQHIICYICNFAPLF